jgi:hypothetical protein
LVEAKLRFHYKLCQGKNPSASRKFYTEHNYLRVCVAGHLAELGLQRYTPDLILRESSKRSLSGWKWKKVVAGALEEKMRRDAVGVCGPLLALKPHPEVCGWVDRVPPHYLTTFMATRHGAHPRMGCPCVERPLQIDVGWHLLFECGLLDNAVGRLALGSLLDDAVPGGDGLSNLCRYRILLGGPVVGVGSAVLEVLRNASARYLSRAVCCLKPYEG